MSEPTNEVKVGTEESVVVTKKKKVVAPIIKDTNSSEIILKDTELNDVEPGDYFYDESGKKEGKPSSSFHKVCGYPVDRADLLGTFHKVFKPEHGLLFYKDMTKELYLVIVPLEKSSTLGPTYESKNGDYQRHAISFLNEGAVNVDTLKKKLEQIKKFVKYDDR